MGQGYPVSGQAVNTVPGSKARFTSSEAKGLLYDVLAVNPGSLGKRKDDWAKVVGVFYKCVNYIKDPATQPDAVAIMAAKVGADAADYAKNIPGTHFLTLAEAQEAYKKGDGLDSVYGFMTGGNKFNLANNVYKVSQKPETYIASHLVAVLKSQRAAMA